jgi:acetyltransferase-like isoleucine patch superfamily enzyme
MQEMSLRSITKGLLRQYPGLLPFLFRFHNGLLGFNSVKIGQRGNRLQGTPLLSHCKILVTGKNNTILFGSMSRLTRCTIRIYGSNNRIIVGDDCIFHEGDFWIEDDGNCISVGNGTSISGSTHLAATEGTTILIGRDCMFSGEIAVRTGDSHSIIEAGSNIRITHASDVTIGDHVWIGSRVILLKGSSVPDNSVVATGAIVTKKHDGANVILAGSPAKVVREKIDWLRARIR